MKSLFLSISLLFVSTSFAQKLLPERDVRQQVFAGEKFFKLYTTDEPLDGTYKVVMSGGAYYEATFVEGRINGAYKRYNGEGKLTAEEHYKNGKNDGTWKYYNDKGKLISLKNYKDGKPWANGNSGMTMPSGYSQNLITKAKKITPCAYIMIMANYPKNILTKKVKKMALKSITKEKAICQKNF